MQSGDRAATAKAVETFDQMDRARQYHRASFEQSLDGILILEPENTGLIEFNNAAHEMFGFTREEFSMTRLNEHEHNEPPRITRTAIADVLASKRGIIETIGRTKGGSDIHIRLEISTFELNGRTLLCAICKDVSGYVGVETELRRMVDEFGRSNKELEQFAYIASHDLQEPLRMVASFAQLLSTRYRGQFDSDADEFIDFIVDGATRMQSLINALLAFSRVESKGKAFTPTDTGAVLTEVVENLHVAIQENEAEITFGNMPNIMADEHQLYQVFQNLIANAIKFRGDSPPKIQIDVSRKNECWMFAVRDNGIGIDTRDYNVIFQIFQRLHERDQFDGTGMGLAICKKIIERHGGRLWVESCPGEGSTFYFTLACNGRDADEPK